MLKLQRCLDIKLHNLNPYFATTGKENCARDSLLGSPSTYILLTAIQLAYATSAMKPLKFIVYISFSTMTKFKFPIRKYELHHLPIPCHNMKWSIPYKFCYHTHDTLGWSNPLDVWHDQILSMNPKHLLQPTYIVVRQILTRCKIHIVFYFDLFSLIL